MTDENATQDAPTQLEVAVVGGGCFWCLEAVFMELAGVRQVESGYAGGETENPTYKEVCTGETGHAEVVQITFDPNVISYSDLLTVFFHSHDPTTLNRQGPDEGTQYRSIILTRSEDQKATAEVVKVEMGGEGIWEGAFVTEIFPFTRFFKAEQSHQDYYRLNPDKGYCQMVISPKVIKMRKLFADRLK